MAAPVMTQNATGNILASSALALSASTANLDIDATTKFELELQIGVTFGAVAATNGLQVNVYRLFGAGPTADTIQVTQFTIPGTASTTKNQSLALPTGRYRIVLTNLDATNGLTGVTVTSSTIDSIV